MVLSSTDKKNVKQMWESVRNQEEILGAEALNRMFISHPKTKIYFSGKDLTDGSAFLHSHGKKVMCALTKAVDHIDNIDAALSALSDKHAHELMVDPANFPHLAHNILLVFGIHFKSLLTCQMHTSLDKFLCAVASTLTSKYR